MARATCYRCDKPQVACICATLKEVANRTPVWVIQHPRERRHPLGTARIARLGLEQVEVVLTHGEDAAPSLPPGAGLLYPGGEELREEDELGALVVIDGTWPQAKSLYGRCGWLRKLPRYALTPRQQSRYRLRREPAPHCVSTIEAIVEALRRLEPDTPRLEGLLDAFDAMIDRQIALSPGWDGPRPPRHWRHSFVDDIERIVAVDVDLGPRDAGPPLLLHTVAWRLASGETFEAFVRPEASRRPHACHLAHLE
ncbi:MAG: tRNA-uridine aminocarboxypropyltransferase, partial [Bacteroidota bacterium]